MNKFKYYEQNQVTLLPENLSDFIDEGDMVRVVNDLIDKVNLGSLYSTYSGGGATSYHPKMLLKVIIYAYCRGINSSREIESALTADIKFMWLSGKSKPDHSTITRFRKNKMKDLFESIFTDVVRLFADKGYIDLDNYFIDGTKIEANANKYSYVWKKSTQKYYGALKDRLHEHLEAIDEINEYEDNKYGKIDTKNISSKEIYSLADKMSKEAEKISDKKVSNKSATKIKQLKRDFADKAKKYEDQLEILEERNSYSKTDTDATFMRMKEDLHKAKPTLKPGYNIQIGTSNQFVTHFSADQKQNDLNSLIPDLEGLKDNFGKLPTNVIADAGYGSEENYKYLEDNGVNAFVKYNMFHKRSRGKSNKFDKDKWEYNEKKDFYICPNNKTLHYVGETIEKSINGYKKVISQYECKGCKGCFHFKECVERNQRVIQTNRCINTSRVGRRLEEKARTLLNSEIGVEFRKRRNIEPETVFANIKQNLGLRRFRLRGLDGIKLEFGLYALAHNIRKVTRLTPQMAQITLKMA
jgi:transposase